MRSHPQYRGKNFRRRVKRLRPDVKQLFRFQETPQHDGQASIGFAPGGGGYPIDDFLLQHEMHVTNVFAKIQQVKQQRGRDVVWEIPGDAQVVAETREVEAQRVGFVHCNPAVCRVTMT
jgi:hypothetical protein